MGRCWSRVPQDRPKFDEVCYLLKEILSGSSTGQLAERDMRRLSAHVDHEVIIQDDPSHASGATTV